MVKRNIYWTSRYTEFTLLDKFYQEILGSKTNGSFLEIGAFDGETNSKTAHLADIGWNGIYLEPVKEYYEKCKQRHKLNNVKVINAAVGDKDGTAVIYTGGLPSTLVESSKNHLEKFAQEQGFSFNFKEEKVKVYSWNTILMELENQVPDILVMDAEGFDLKILRSIDFNSFRPKIIFAEVFPEDTPFMHDSVKKEGQEILELLSFNNYHVWLKEHHNVLFVEGESIADRLAYMSGCNQNKNHESILACLGSIRQPIFNSESDSIVDFLIENNFIEFVDGILNSLEKKEKLEFIRSVLVKLELIASIRLEEYVNAALVNWCYELGIWERLEILLNKSGMPLKKEVEAILIKSELYLKTNREDLAIRLLSESSTLTPNSMKLYIADRLIKCSEI